MAIIPLKQKIKVYRDGGTDDWGYPIPGKTFEYKARVDEVTEVVQNQAGEETVTGMQIWLDRLADIRYSDEIEYIDELERKTKRMPVKIEPVRMINGKAILTLVYL